MVWFWVERSRLVLKLLTAIRRGFELYECLLVGRVLQRGDVSSGWRQTEQTQYHRSVGFATRRLQQTPPT